MLKHFGVLLLMMREACGCKWDDEGSPIDMCELHCPPYEQWVPTDEYLAVIMTEKGQTNV